MKIDLTIEFTRNHYVYTVVVGGKTIEMKSGTALRLAKLLLTAVESEPQ